MVAERQRPSDRRSPIQGQLYQPACTASVSLQVSYDVLLIAVGHAIEVWVKRNNDHVLTLLT